MPRSRVEASGASKLTRTTQPLRTGRNDGQWGAGHLTRAPKLWPGHSGTVASVKLANALACGSQRRSAQRSAPATPSTACDTPSSIGPSSNSEATTRATRCRAAVSPPRSMTSGPVPRTVPHVSQKRAEARERVVQRGQILPPGLVAIGNWRFWPIAPPFPLGRLGSSVERDRSTQRRDTAGGEALQTRRIN